MFRHRVCARALVFRCFVLVLLTVGQTTNANQNNPWNVAQGQQQCPGRQRPESKESLYASVGAVLTQYELDVKDATLTPRSSVVLPRNVQYAWPSPDHRVLYVVLERRSLTDRPLGEQGISSFRIDKQTGALTPFRHSGASPKRPVHIATDNAGRYLLAAHNHPPAGLTVWTINADGSLGAEVPQPGVIDGGIYAHQILVDPFDRMAILTTRGNVPAKRHPASRSPAR